MIRIAVIGSGTMGNGIAHVFAQHGHPVSLIDISAEALERATATIAKNLDRQVKKGTLAADQVEAVLGRITTSTDLSAAVNAAIVVEAASENPEIKYDIFTRLDRLCPPDTILASNTSSISITDIAAQTGRPDRVIGMHFMNPVPVMELVEVIRGKGTSDETTATVMQLSRDLGKTPVEVNDSPGFVSNRVLLPMINEAAWCVHEGVATPEGVDTVMKLGMAHPMGPLTLADLIGIDVCLAILQVLQRGLDEEKYKPCPLFAEMVARGELGRKSGKGFYDYSTGKS
jgi:3-hydroxybutyryl-CoA dehydrogenase